MLASYFTVNNCVLEFSPRCARLCKGMKKMNKVGVVEGKLIRGARKRSKCSRKLLLRKGLVESSEYEGFDSNKEYSF